MIFSKLCRFTVASELSQNISYSLNSFRSVHRTCRNNKCLTVETINPNLKEVEYAITGPLLQRALQIEKELDKGVRKPFQNVKRLNIGDAHSLGQPPITFLRQVLALTAYPQLLESKKFPEDAKNRARDILNKCPGGSLGSYSDACGMEIIRRRIASYLEERDHISSKWEDCIMGHGASDIIKKFIFNLCAEVNGLRPGILNPVPEYPFYSAAFCEFGIKRIDYYLEEENNWRVNFSQLQRAIDEARNICHPRAIVVVNPGNPTGHVLDKQSIKEIIRFAHKENLIIIADEVHQHSIIKDDKNFISFKKVMTEMGKPYSQLELVSLMSVSKGYFAECGIKGGFGEFLNLESEVVPMFVKSISASLCSSVLAQAAVYAFTFPPKPNEPSFEQFEYEKKSIMGALKMSAEIVQESFNSLDGVNCNSIEGATFCFPQIDLPKNVIDTAKKINLEPDAFYAIQLLNETGICVVPGSGFGQLPGKYHIRMTLLPQPDELHKLMERYKKFHYKFLKKYSDMNMALSV